VLLALAVVSWHESLLWLNWGLDAIPALLILSAAIFAVWCGVLRTIGFRIQRQDRVERQSPQFGVKHMLLWTTAMAPLLVVLRDFDWRAFKLLGKPDLVPAALFCGMTSLAALGALWLTLGARHFWLSASVLGIVVVGASAVLQHESLNLVATYGKYPDPIAAALVVRFSPLWTAWFTLVAALMAAMLLFLRACGSRLVRTSPNEPITGD
jgi:hypothetical protein